MEDMKAIVAQRCHPQVLYHKDIVGACSFTKRIVVRLAICVMLVNLLVSRVQLDAATALLVCIRNGVNRLVKSALLENFLALSGPQFALCVRKASLLLSRGPQHAFCAHSANLLKIQQRALHVIFVLLVICSQCLGKVRVTFVRLENFKMLSVALNVLNAPSEDMPVNPVLKRATSVQQENFNKNYEQRPAPTAHLVNSQSRLDLQHAQTAMRAESLHVPEWTNVQIVRSTKCQPVESQYVRTAKTGLLAHQVQQNVQLVVPVNISNFARAPVIECVWIVLLVNILDAQLVLSFHHQITIQFASHVLFLNIRTSLAKVFVENVKLVNTMI